MALTISCPKCFTRLSVDDDIDPDARVECTRCGKRFPPFQDDTPSSTAGWCRVSQCICMLLGLLVAGVAFQLPAPTAAVCAGLACFCGILARIFQAEAHEQVRRQ